MSTPPTGRIVNLSGNASHVDTGLNVAHVDDIAYGHLLAYRFGRARLALHFGGQYDAPADSANHR